MKIWKKHMEISFILVLVFVLIGCSSEQKSTNTTKTENPQPDTEMNESLKAKLVPVHTDEFTFYVMPEWTKRNNEYIYDVASGNEGYGITGISNLGSKKSEDFFKDFVKYVDEEKGKEVIKYSDALIERKTAQGVVYQIGWVDVNLKGIPHYVVMVMSPQKNVAISFFAQLRENNIPREQVYKTIEMMYKDIEFHLGEKDYVSGNTFIVGENSEICFYKDKTFKFYKSKDDHENYYYEGTYDVFYGEAAVDEIVSLEEYGITKKDVESFLANAADNNISLRSDKPNEYFTKKQKQDDEETYKACKDTFYAIILHNKNLVTSPSKSEKKGHDTLYVGHYVQEKKALDLENVNANSIAFWQFSKISE